MKNSPKVKSYIIGFIVSLILTLTAYFLAKTSIGLDHSDFEKNTLLFLLLSLALLQYIAQAYWFFHLGEDSKRGHLWMFLITSALILIIVVGSVWVMKNLDYNMMGNPDIEQDIIKDELLKHQNNSTEDHGNH
jgi:cytochrome o ubiquinol oxidase operon protein cyoD